MIPLVKSTFFKETETKQRLVDFIIKSKIAGKNKNKTLLLLQQYQKTNNKSMAMMVLTNSLNNAGCFST